MNLARDACRESNSGIQVSAQPKKIVDINEPQKCRNHGCGLTFKEKENHDTACSYHPGPAVFRGRIRGVSIIYFTAYFSLITSLVVI